MFGARVARDEIKIFRALALRARARARVTLSRKENAAGIRVTKHEKSSYFTIYLAPGGIEMAHPRRNAVANSFSNFTRSAQQFCCRDFYCRRSRGKEKCNFFRPRRNKVNARYRLSSSISPFLHFSTTMILYSRYREPVGNWNTNRNNTIRRKLYSALLKFE